MHTHTYYHVQFAEKLLLQVTILGSSPLSSYDFRPCANLSLLVVNRALLLLMDDGEERSLCIHVAWSTRFNYEVVKTFFVSLVPWLNWWILNSPKQESSPSLPLVLLHDLIIISCLNFVLSANETFSTEPDTCNCWQHVLTSTGGYFACDRCIV